MRKWYAKWQYHRKQPAFRSILKFNGLWALMYLFKNRCSFQLVVLGSDNVSICLSIDLCFTSER